jgi:hypothetical protein
MESQGDDASFKVRKFGGGSGKALFDTPSPRSDKAGSRLKTS